VYLGLEEMYYVKTIQSPATFTFLNCPNGLIDVTVVPFSGSSEGLLW
jgi:hypothetical protein